VETSARERIKNCGFVHRVGAVAAVPARSSVVLSDWTQESFPRPVSDPLAHSCGRIRGSGAELFDNLTDR
jgi:hypothetical protein